MIIASIFLLLVPAFASTPLSVCEEAGSGEKVVDIVVGGEHTCALSENGKVKCWGVNVSGQLGQGDAEDRGDDEGEMDTLQFINFGTDERVVQLSAGFYHTCALFENGMVKCWGNNSSGQLGLGDEDDQGTAEQDMTSLPWINFGTVTEKIQRIESGFFHTCALFGKGKLKCWGHNTSGQLGLGDTNHRGDEETDMGDNLPFVDLQIGSLVRPEILIIGSGVYSNLVLLEGGYMKGWGNNYYNQVGLNEDDFNFNVGDGTGEMGLNLNVLNANVPEDGRIQSFCTGDFSCLLYSTSTGTPNESRHVACWGSNAGGVVGAGNTSKRLPSSPYIVQLGEGMNPSEVYCGWGHACVRSENGKVKCWGDNTNGRLGLGDTDNRGGGEDEMGDFLPFVDLGEGRSAVKLALGLSHSCALLDNSEVKCWGSNSYGELGLGDVSERLTPQTVPVGCYETCVDIRCPQYSSCEVVDSTPSCKCDNNFVNKFSPIGSRMVESDGECIPEILQVDSSFVSKEFIKLTIPAVPSDIPTMNLGIELHKWISDSEKVRVGNEDYIPVTTVQESESEKVIGPVEPGFMYQVSLFPVPSTDPSPVENRDMLYTETIQTQPLCPCYSNMQQHSLDPVAYQEEGLVMFRIPDVSVCQLGYEVSRLEHYDTTINVQIPGQVLSTFDEPRGECSTGYLEPGNQVVDDLRSSKLSVGETFSYEINVGLGDTFEPMTVKHTVQWESSVSGKVLLSGTNRPAAGVSVWYQLQTLQNDVISDCSGDNEIPPTGSWCETIATSDGTFHLSFNMIHPSLWNIDGARLHYHAGECIDEGVPCDNENVVNLEHLLFNVPVELEYSGVYEELQVETGNSSMTLITLGAGTFGGTLLLVGSVFLCFTKRGKSKKNDLSQVVRMDAESLSSIKQ